MQLVKAIADLETLRVFCEDPQEPEEGLLYAAVAFATHHTRSNLGFISVVDPENEASLHAQERYVVAPSPKVWRYNGRFSLRIGGTELSRNERSLSGYVAHTRRPYRCPDVQQDPYYLSVDDNVCSEIGAPIIQGDQLLGVINVESYTREHYSPQHEDFLGRVATLIAGPLARLRAREQTALIPRLVAADFARLCQDHHSTSQDFLNAVLQRIAERMKISKGYARIKDGQELVLRACWPLEKHGSERLLFHQGLFLAIGAEELPPDQRSFAGYIAKIAQPRLVEDLPTFLYYMVAYPELQSALGAPIVYGSHLLGIITLMHDEKGYYTAWHEHYLSAFVRQFAGPLYGLLTAERYRTPQKAVRSTIKTGLQSMGTDDPFGTYEGTHFVAAQIAHALRSTLCTIWLVDARNDLTWQGVCGLPPTSAIGDVDQDTRVSQAIHNVFGVRPATFCPGTVACGETCGWKALQNQQTYNCGPNRDHTFLSQGYVQPFLVMPLLSYESHALGVIHVGMKETTLDNPYGFYSEADEQLLENLQMEVVDLYERRQLRRTAE
ncbi:MAG: GAF domain-containing protein, partial [Deltaproteobacteria bacterium]|nr:GAF domain-containing protein [Deltaproteobacteria bacterium]